MLCYPRVAFSFEISQILNRGLVQKLRDLKEKRLGNLYTLAVLYRGRGISCCHLPGIVLFVVFVKSSEHSTLRPNLRRRKMRQAQGVLLLRGKEIIIILLFEVIYIVCIYHCKYKIAGAYADRKTILDLSKFWI